MNHRDNMPQKYIFFDIDNTLFPTSQFLVRADENAINAMISRGLACCFDDAMEMLRKIQEKKGSNYSKHFDLLVKETNGRRDLKIVAAGIVAYHNTKNAMAPYPEVLGVLMRLHDKGHKLYIATEGIEIKQWDKLIRLGLDMYFDKVYVAKQKNRAFYEHIMKREKVAGKECVMIGDRPDKDTWPAMLAGMYTIRVKRGKYEKESARGKAHKEICDLRNLPEIIEKL